MYTKYINKMLTKSKAQRAVGVIRFTTKGCFNRAMVTKNIWEKCVLPGILYGVEVVPIADSHVEKLEQIQNEVGRWALGISKWTGVEAIRGELGWYRINRLNSNEKIKILQLSSKLPRKKMV